MKHFKFLSVLLLITIVVVSCKKKDFPDEQYIEFAKHIEESIAAGNADLLNAAFDYNSFEKIVFDGLKLTEDQKIDADKYIREYIRPGSIKVDAVTYGADFHFTKFYRDSLGNARIIFRLYNNGGISIEDWEMKVVDKEIKIVDAFAVASGIKWSEDCRQQICNHLNIINEEVMNLNRLIQVNIAIGNEDFAAADSILFYTLPQTKDLMYANVLNLNLSSITDDYENVKTTADQFVKKFPDEDRIATFYLMQSAIGNGLVEEVSAQIDKMVNMFGNDPIYYVYLSWVFQNADAYDLALEAMDSAITYLPSLFDLYIEKMDIFYLQEQYSQIAEELNIIDELFLPGKEDDDYFSRRYPKARNNTAFKQWIDKRNYLNYDSLNKAMGF